MSPDVIAVGIFTLLGVLGGVIIERVTRSWGRLWCELFSCEVRYVAPDEMGGYTSLDPEEAGDNWRAEYAVSLDLYNGKEIPVGLRDISVVISYDGDKKQFSRPWDETSRRFSDHMSTYDTLELVNLAPRQWVRLKLLGNLEGSKISKGWRRIEFVAERRGLFGTVRRFRKVVASR